MKETEVFQAPCSHFSTDPQLYKPSIHQFSPPSLQPRGRQNFNQLICHLYPFQRPPPPSLYSHQHQQRHTHHLQNLHEVSKAQYFHPQQTNFSQFRQPSLQPSYIQHTFLTHQLPCLENKPPTTSSKRHSTSAGFDTLNYPVKMSPCSTMQSPMHSLSSPLFHPIYNIPLYLPSSQMASNASQQNSQNFPELMMHLLKQPKKYSGNKPLKDPTPVLSRDLHQPLAMPVQGPHWQVGNDVFKETTNRKEIEFSSNQVVKKATIMNPVSYIDKEIGKGIGKEDDEDMSNDDTWLVGSKSCAKRDMNLATLNYWNDLEQMPKSGTNVYYACETVENDEIDEKIKSTFDKKEKLEVDGEMSKSIGEMELGGEEWWRAEGDTLFQEISESLLTPPDSPFLDNGVLKSRNDMQKEKNENNKTDSPAQPSDFSSFCISNSKNLSEPRHESSSFLTDFLLKPDSSQHPQHCFDHNYCGDDGKKQTNISRLHSLLASYLLNPNLDAEVRFESENIRRKNREIGNTCAHHFVMQDLIDNESIKTAGGFRRHEINKEVAVCERNCDGQSEVNERDMSLRNRKKRKHEGSLHNNLPSGVEEETKKNKRNKKRKVKRW